MLTSFLTILADAADVEIAQLHLKGVAAMAAAIAVLGGMAVAIGQGYAASKAVEGVARNPESAGKVRSTLMMGCALAETTGIYSLVISILIIFFIAL